MESNEKSITVARRLFVGNIPYSVRWQDVKDHFKKAGQVVRVVIAKHQDKQPKGHAFVLFSTIEDAQKAIDMFDNTKWLGRVIEVSPDHHFVEVDKEQPKESIENSIVDNEDCKQLFVGNVPFHCEWKDLKDLFRSSGPVVRADIVLNFDGSSRGFGTVLFGCHQDAKNAIEQYNGYKFHNRILRVHFDKFEASYQKLQELEDDSIGLRPIDDPVSVELLRQTYAVTQPSPSVPSYSSNYYNNIYTGGYIPQYLPSPIYSQPDPVSYYSQHDPAFHYSQLDPISHYSLQQQQQQQQQQQYELSSTFLPPPTTLASPRYAQRSSLPSPHYS